MTTDTYNKPVPKITPDNKGFWDSCKRHELALQKCDECGTFRYFVSPICPNCGSFDYAWTPVSGKAEVYCYTIVYRPLGPTWADDVPYVFAYVMLDEGVLLPTNIVGCPPESVHSGMKLQVTYDDVTAELTIPKFTPV